MLVCICLLWIFSVSAIHFTEANTISALALNPSLPLSKVHAAVIWYPKFSISKSSNWEVRHAQFIHLEDLTERPHIKENNDGSFIIIKQLLILTILSRWFVLFPFPQIWLQQCKQHRTTRWCSYNTILLSLFIHVKFNIKMDETILLFFYEICVTRL